jgi:hypothetical protein
LAADTHLMPADLEPQFHRLDPGYLTSEPGTRYATFTAKANPSELAFDETHKGTVAFTEIATFPLIVAHPLDIRVPALLVDGALESLFCGAFGEGAERAKPQALIVQERPHLVPATPSVDAISVADSRHDINMALDANQVYGQMQRWMDAKPASLPASSS